MVSIVIDPQKSSLDENESNDNHLTFNKYAGAKEMASGFETTFCLMPFEHTRTSTPSVKSATYLLDLRDA